MKPPQSIPEQVVFYYILYSLNKMDIEMFLCSVKNLGVRFMKYIEDGDSRTYSGIPKAAPYGKDVVEKKSALVLCITGLDKCP